MKKRAQLKFLDYDVTLWHSSIFPLYVDYVLCLNFDDFDSFVVLNGIISFSLQEKGNNSRKRSLTLKQRLTVSTMKSNKVTRDNRGARADLSH